MLFHSIVIKCIGVAIPLVVNFAGYIFKVTSRAIKLSNIEYASKFPSSIRLGHPWPL
jgi:hypothetical protein